MTSNETWTKALRCPVCGLEGAARLSHVEDSSNPYATQTIVDECPDGFQAREDEDDCYIVRFFCIADAAAADQG